MRIVAESTRIYPASRPSRSAPENVTLLELTAAYGVFANQGSVRGAAARQSR